MLSAMRDGKYRYFFYGLLALLALGLIGFGSGGIGHGSVSAIGKVGEQDVRVDTYARTLQSAIQNTSRQVGRNLSPAEVEMFGIQRNVLQAVLSSAALDNEAKQLGLSVGDEVVATNIRQNRVYQGLDGGFDKEAYDFALERSGITAKENEESIREAAARSLLETAVAGGLTNGTTAAEALVSFSGEKRNFDWAILADTSLQKGVGEPTDEQLQSFYEENQGKYTALESREITYAWVTPTMLLDQVTIPEEKLLVAFNEQQDRFSRPARRIVDRLVFPTAEEATTAKAQLDDQDVTFLELIEIRGLTEDDISLGVVEIEDLGTGAADEVFKAAEPGVYGPFDSDLGPALYRVNAILAAEDTGFEDAREELNAEMAGDAATRMIQGMMEDAQNLLAGGASLEELVQDTELELGKISLNSESEDEIAGYSEFREEAYGVTTNSFPDILPLSDGGIFALRLDEIKEAAVRPFASIKDQIKVDWTIAETLKLLEKNANEIVAKLDNGASFADVGLDAQSMQDAERTPSESDVPHSVTLASFDVEEGKAFTFTDDNQVYVGKVTSVSEVNLTDAQVSQTVDQISQQLANQAASDLLSLFAQALQDDAGVSLNQAAINSINSQVTLGQ